MTSRSFRVGRRALIVGPALTAVAAAARAQSQPPPEEPITTLADVPLSSSATVTAERRGEIVLIGLNRPFIQNRLDPPTRVRLAETLYQYEHDPSLRAAVLPAPSRSRSRPPGGERPQCPVKSLMKALALTTCPARRRRPSSRGRAAPDRAGA